MREYLGEFEQLIMLALLRLGDSAYGMSVRREIELRTGREIAIGAVYATLDRLESKDLVESATGSATPERAGRVRRMFLPTPAGLAALQASREAVASMSRGLNLKGTAWKTA